MTDEGGYRLSELAELLDLSPRTIRWYIEKGLLPSQGRQGPNTRYPAGDVHRLKVIKELQQRARISLDEALDVVERLPASRIAAIAAGKEPIDVVDLRMPTHWLGGGPRQVRNRAMAFDTGPARGGQDLVARLRRLAGSERRPSARLADRWTSVAVNENLSFAVRGADETETRDLERLARFLRTLLAEPELSPKRGEWIR